MLSKLDWSKNLSFGKEQIFTFVTGHAKRDLIGILR